MKEKIKFQTGKFERWSYGIYFLGQLISYTIITNYIQLFMQDTGIATQVVAAILLFSKIWDAVNDPLFGVIVDKSKLKGGKYKPWLKLSSFLIPLATIFIFVVPGDMDIKWKAVWIGAGYLLWDLAYTVCDVPIFAVATSMTSDLQERDWLYTFNRLFTFIGSLICIIAMPLLYTSIGWGSAVVVLSVFAFIFLVPIGFSAKERHAVQTEKSPTIKELFQYLVRNKYLLIFNGAAIIAALTATRTVATSYIARYCLGGDEWISVIGILTALPMIVSIIVVQQVIKKVDKFYVYIVCTFASICTSAIIYFTGYENIALFFGLTVVQSIFNGAGTVLGVMFTADCAEYGNFKTGDRAQGMAFSIQTFTEKCKGAISGAMGALILGWIGFQVGADAVQTPETIDWLWKMFTLIPIIGMSISFFLILLCYKLRTKDVQIMMKANYGEISREEALSQISIKI